MVSTSDHDRKEIEKLDDALINAPFTDLDSFEIDTLLEEVNVLDLEGYLFAFDPKNKGLRTGKHKIDLPGQDGRTITLDFGIDYGQPSLLAYRVLQAVFKKITDEGKPFLGVANFGAREFGRICGVEEFGGYQSRYLYRAIQSLHRTHINAEIFDKATEKRTELGFYLFPKVLLSGREGELHTCSIQLEPAIVASLNKDYWVAFNWDRLKELEPIGMAFYKRLYRNFAYIYSSGLRKRKKRGGLSTNDLVSARREVLFKKKYANIVGEWFGGGVKEWKHKSEVKRILGQHMNDLKKTKLIRSWDVQKTKKGELMLVFRPGVHFFRDYEKLWLGQFQGQIRFQQTQSQLEVQEPLELLSYFFEKRFGSVPSIMPKSQSAHAKKIIEKYGFESAKDLVDYTIEEAKKTNFDIQTLNSTKTYIASWEASGEARKRARDRVEEQRQNALKQELEEAYQHFLDKRRADFRESLTEEEFVEYQVRAEVDFDKRNPDTSKRMRPMGTRIATARILLEATNPPTFTEWRDSQNV